MTHLEERLKYKRKCLKIPGVSGEKLLVDFVKNKRDPQKVDVLVFSPFGTTDHQGIIGLNATMAGKLYDKLTQNV